MDFLKVISTTKAKALISEVFASYKLKTESVHILASVGRVLSEDVHASYDVPNFNRSTVDGYAVKSKDTFGCSDSLPSLLDYKGAVQMGEMVHTTVDTSQAIYVPTGGMIPKGADAAVMIEYTDKLDEKTIAINKAVRPGENITYKGDDIKEGNVVFKKGRRITAHDIGVLAALSISSVNVFVKPRVTIISTGDEIVDITNDEEPCRVKDINGYVLYALLEKSCCQVVGKLIVNDDFDKLKATIQESIKLSDIVLLSGGSSVGAKDYTYDIINSLNGRGVFINGLAIKPGKPTIVGEAEGKAVFGLPGHPVSAITVYKILVEHLICEMLSMKEDKLCIDARLETNLHSSPGKETYQLVDIIERESIKIAVPIYGASGLITTLSRAKGYIIIPENIEGIYKDDKVKVYLN